MLEGIKRIRGNLIHWAYVRLAKPLFFKVEPEAMHDAMAGFGARLGGNPVTGALTRLLFFYSNPVLRQDIAGIRFENPVGLAAGFDKNAHLVSTIPHVGFGWMEVGSTTARPCAGNPKPRLHRLPKSRSLVVNHGLTNDGCDALVERLKNRKLAIPIGTSLAPTNDEQTMDYREAIQDYLYSYKKLSKLGAYTTLNLSCPNTCNDQPFADPKKLDELLVAVRKVQTDKPLFLKMSPDLTMAELDALLTVARRHGVQGIICGNLTKNRNNPAIKDAGVPAAGGLSGKVVEAQSDAMIAHIARKWGKTFVIVGCGGVFSAEDAYRKIRLGASLIQLITGMIYEGPQLIGQINQGIAERLKRDGFGSVSEAVGTGL